MKAYQRIIREQEQEDVQDFDLSKTLVKEIDYNTTKDFILRYEWLGCMPAIVLYCYGIFFDDRLGGVVVYGGEYTENRKVWDKYDFTGKIICLARGACSAWTPKNTASKLIRESMKLLPPKYEIVTATVDPLAGEIGTIYQACGFYYVGAMRKNPFRWGFLIDGKIYGSRSMRAKFGCQRIEVIRKHYPDAVVVPQLSKHRYFVFRGSKKTQKKHLRVIQGLIKPYIRRETLDEYLRNLLGPRRYQQLEQLGLLSIRKTLNSPSA